MAALLDLYYSESAEEEGKALDAFLSLVQDAGAVPMQFDRVNRMVRRNQVSSYVDQRKLFDLDELHILKFKEVFHHLYKAILSGDGHHFTLQGIEHHIKVEIMSDESFVDCPNETMTSSIEDELQIGGNFPLEIERQKPHSNESDPSPLVSSSAWRKTPLQEEMEYEKPAKSPTARAMESQGIPASLLHRAAIRTLEENPTQKTTLDHLKIVTRRYTTFDVEPSSHSHFARKLLELKPTEEPRTSIPSLEFPFWSSFGQLLRSFMAALQITGDGYRRLGVCPVCQRAHFIRRMGRTKFCSNSCRRVHFTHDLEPRERFRCRERQKRWAERKFGNPGMILKAHCEGCDQFQKKIPGGRCFRFNKNKISYPV